MAMLTFQSVCKYLEDNKLGNISKKLVKLAILCASFVPGVQAAVSSSVLLATMLSIGVFDIIDEVGGLLGSAKDAVYKHKSSSYVDRAKRMENIFGMLCVTAYFEALSDMLTIDHRKAIQLLPEDITLILKNSSFDIETVSAEHLQMPQIPMLTIAMPYDQVREQISDMYRVMAERTIRLYSDFACFYDGHNGERLAAHLRGLHDMALHYFDAQLSKLASDNNELFIHLQLQQIKATQKLVSETAVQIEMNILENMFDALQDSEFKQANDALKDYYRRAIEQPILEDTDMPEDDESSRLAYPRICDAFVPQAYRVLAYTKHSNLEDRRNWQSIGVRNDLMEFFTRYLVSYESIYKPLLVLGHPGSGKSLLTKVLASQIAGDTCAVVRIPLREVNIEEPLDTLIMNQVHKQTRFTHLSWGTFAAHCKDRPMLLILDGFDEVLQVTGNNNLRYITKKVHQFQKDELAKYDCPIRVIITSRITLINTVEIPEDTPVLRLIGFDDQRIDAWRAEWNRVNARFYADNRVNQFCLPKDQEDIRKLAEQPLLLLMLAIYDSEQNALHKDQHITRSAVYRELLHRFVRRDRRRSDNAFDQQAEDDQEIHIERAMDALRMIALTMNNEQKPYIQQSDLQTDLDNAKAFAEKHKLDVCMDEVVPANLLRGFFFVHTAYVENADEKDYSYEFLHKTFGEYLYADFLVQAVLAYIADNESGSISVAMSLYNIIMALAIRPLANTLEILPMIMEIFSYQQQNKRFDTQKTEAFASQMDGLLKIILGSKDGSAMITNTAPEKYNEMSGLHLCATLSMNIVLLRAMIAGKDGFAFPNLGNSGSGVLQWRMTGGLWRSVYGVDGLLNLSGLLDVRNNDAMDVHITLTDALEERHLLFPKDESPVWAFTYNFEGLHDPASVHEKHVRVSRLLLEYVQTFAHAMQLNSIPKCAAEWLASKEGQDDVTFALLVRRLETAMCSMGVYSTEYGKRSGIVNAFKACFDFLCDDLSRVEVQSKIILNRYICLVTELFREYRLPLQAEVNAFERISMLMREPKWQSWGKWSLLLPGYVWDSNFFLKQRSAPNQASTIDRPYIESLLMLRTDVALESIATQTLNRVLTVNELLVYLTNNEPFWTYVTHDPSPLRHLAICLCEVYQNEPYALSHVNDLLKKIATQDYRSSELSNQEDIILETVDATFRFLSLYPIEEAQPFFKLFMDVLHGYILHTGQLVDPCVLLLKHAAKLPKGDLHTMCESLIECDERIETSENATFSILYIYAAYKAERTISSEYIEKMAIPTIVNAEAQFIPSLAWFAKGEMMRLAGLREELRMLGFFQE